MVTSLKTKILSLTFPSHALLVVNTSIYSVLLSSQSIIYLTFSHGSIQLELCPRSRSSIFGCRIRRVRHTTPDQDEVPRSPLQQTQIFASQPVGPLLSIDNNFFYRFNENHHNNSSDLHCDNIITHPENIVHHK